MLKVLAKKGGAEVGKKRRALRQLWGDESVPAETSAA